MIAISGLQVESSRCCIIKCRTYDCLLPTYFSIEPVTLCEKIGDLRFERYCGELHARPLPICYYVVPPEVHEDCVEPLSHREDALSQRQARGTELIPRLLHVAVPPVFCGDFKQRTFKGVESFIALLEVFLMENGITRVSCISGEAILKDQTVLGVEPDISHNELLLRELYVERTQNLEGLLSSLSFHLGQLVTHLGQLSPDWSCSQEGCKESTGGRYGCLVPIQPEFEASRGSRLLEFRKRKSRSAAQRCRNNHQKCCCQPEDAPKFQPRILVRHRCAPFDPYISKGKIDPSSIFVRQGGYPRVDEVAA